MKSTGVVRHVDRLGRVVVPMELRNNLHMDSFSDVEMWQDGDTVILMKFVPGCVICGNKENTVTYQEKTVCHDCVTELQAEVRTTTVATAVNV